MIRERWRGGAVLRRLGVGLDWQSCWLCRGASHAALLCGFCRRDLPRCPGELDRARLARRCGLDALAVRFDYRFPLDVLITRFKYHGELALASALGDLLPPPPAGGIPGAGGRVIPIPDRQCKDDPERPWLVAVPGDVARIRRHGYDQIALLAGAYGRRHGLQSWPAARTRSAPPQAGLPARERASNLREAFRIKPLPEGSRLLLLDDVLTTGATLAALAAAGRAAGAGWVGAVVLARTPEPRELRPGSA